MEPARPRAGGIIGAVTVAFLLVRDSRIGELAATFDIVLGLTPGS